MKYPTSSLLISTYNRPDALRVCIKSALRQTVLPGEILIADDGSGEATREVIGSFQNEAQIPIRHIWQEDLGFRLAAIRNKAIAVSQMQYIIQVDGDMILHPNFIEDHVEFARPDCFVRASRIYMDPKLTTETIESQNININIFDHGISNFFSAFRIPFLWPIFAVAYKQKGEERYEIHGANMAFWRQDALDVNGYNEDFIGWGPEDKEFVARLLNRGRQKRFLKLGGIAFHLFHTENAKPNLERNDQLLKQTILSNSTYCSRGIDKN